MLFVEGQHHLSQHLKASIARLQVAQISLPNPRLQAVEFHETQGNKQALFPN
jgi:hypothetical protein